MAQPVAHAELGRWRGEQVRLGQVIDALAVLRRREQRTATRASVTNLVLVAADEEEVERACGAVHRLGRRHPGRNIVLLPRPGHGPAGMDAAVLLHGTVAEGHPVWSEDICLTVRGPAASQLDSLIEPLTLPDLPVVAWFVSGLPDPDDRLLSAVSAVVIDGDTLELDAVAALTALGRRHVVLDLCWARLRPWRQLLAGLFEVPAARPALAGVYGVEVYGPAWPRLLLGGWAAARLGLAATSVTLHEGSEPAIRLLARHGGEQGVFVAEQSGAAVVRAWTSFAAAAGREDRLSLPEDPLAWSLGHVLTRVDRDHVHGQALQVAVGFTG